MNQLFLFAIIFIVLIATILLNGKALKAVILMAVFGLIFYAMNKKQKEDSFADNCNKNYYDGNFNENFISPECVDAVNSPACSQFYGGSCADGCPSELDARLQDAAPKCDPADLRSVARDYHINNVNVRNVDRATNSPRTSGLIDIKPNIYMENRQEYFEPRKCADPYSNITNVSDTVGISDGIPRTSLGGNPHYPFNYGWGSDTGYLGCYPPPPIDYNTVDINSRMGYDERQSQFLIQAARDKKAADGFTSRNANYYKKYFGPEIEYAESRVWWGNNES